jgi:hypothetical protein
MLSPTQQMTEFRKWGFLQEHTEWGRGMPLETVGAELLILVPYL